MRGSLGNLSILLHFFKQWNSVLQFLDTSCVAFGVTDGFRAWALLPEIQTTTQTTVEACNRSRHWNQNLREPLDPSPMFPNLSAIWEFWCKPAEFLCQNLRIPLFASMTFLQRCATTTSVCTSLSVMLCSRAGQDQASAHPSRIQRHDQPSKLMDYKCCWLFFDGSFCLHHFFWYYPSITLFVLKNVRSFVMILELCFIYGDKGGSLHDCTEYQIL